MQTWRKASSQVSLLPYLPRPFQSNVVKLAVYLVTSNSLKLDLVACKGETQKRDVAIRPLGQDGKENAWFLLLDFYPSRGTAVWQPKFGVFCGTGFLLRVKNRASPAQWERVPLPSRRHGFNP